MKKGVKRYKTLLNKLLLGISVVNPWDIYKHILHTKLPIPSLHLKTSLQLGY